MVDSSEAFFHFYRKARRSLQQGRLQLALGYLQRSIDLNPRFYDAYHLLGEVLRKLGRTEEAYRVVRQLDKELGFDPEIRLELARLECDRHRYSRALRLLRQVLRRHPDMAEAYFVMGELFRAQGQLEKADDCYAKCLENQPTHAGARRGVNEMMRHSLELGPEVASAIDEEGAEREPSLEERLVAAGEEIEQGHFDTAIAALKELSRDYPGHETVTLALAFALQKKGQVPAAVRQLEGYLSEHPGSPLVHYQCGLLLNQLKSYAEARAHLEAALAEDADYYEALFEFAVTCHRSGDLAAAEQAYVRAARLMPTDVRPQVNLAHLNLRRKRYEQAEKGLRNVLKEEPHCLEALQVLGGLYLKKKHIDRAERCFQAILRLAPYHLQALKGLARIRQERRDYRGALAEWKRAAQIQPLDASVKENIARLEVLLEENRQPGRAEDQVFT